MIPTSPLIVCFGDSLTVGYQSPTPDCLEYRETPYGAFLQEHLGARARVRISGVCGELTAEMLLRFRQDVLQRGPTYVVVLGGTNDLGWNAHPSAIMRNLLKMYELALAASVRPVAVTVPSIRGDADVRVGEGTAWLEGHITNRRILNHLIMDYCKRKAVACVDLFEATQEPKSGSLAEQYSNDGLHLSSNGYRMLATLLFEQVFAVELGGPH
ncbi:GDSL-type esterase/lipase family protein [Nitrospiraceae bacterium AH_259_D15_M11_P09]|nr:GDSL-type esterase/lipase family protein [Nitrospiraceae bacterium AH_259_D15_M11_P09]